MPILRPHEDETGELRELWKIARDSGMSRRQFIFLLTSAGAAAVFSACVPKIQPVSIIPSTLTPVPTTPAPMTPTPPSAPTPTPEQHASLLSFDGISNYVNISDAPILRVDTHFSVEAWVQPAIQPVIYTKVVSKNSVAYDWYLGMDTLDYQTFAFGVYNTVLDNHKVRSLTKFIPGKLYHVLGTFNGSNTELFLDGLSQGITTFWGERPALNSDITFGCQNQIGLIYRFFKGLIGQVRLYDRVLDAEEAMANSKGGLKAPPTNPTGLIGWWPCNEGTGNPHDNSGKGNNGVITGATWYVKT